MGEMSLTVISQTAVPFTSSLSFSPSFDGPFMHKPNVGAGSTPFLIAASPADVSLVESQAAGARGKKRKDNAESFLTLHQLPCVYVELEFAG